jgi:hypothetical protein
VDIAKCFKGIYGKNHVCCSIKEKIWYYFDDDKKIWENDERLMVRYKISEDLFSRFQIKLNETIEKGIEMGNENNDAIKKKIGKIADVMNMLKKTNDKNNILRELQEQLIDTNFLKDMNREKFMLPIKNNKMLNMKTLEITERSFENKFDFICDAEYIEMSEEDESYINKYFMDLFVNNEEVMQCVLNILKSSLTGELLRYMIFHTGGGSNGKSLLFKILNCIFPVIMNVVSKDVIIEKKSNSHINTEYEKLENCRLAYVSELKEKDVLNVDNIKSISGGDPIDLRGIQKTNRTITPVSTLHVLTNNLPKFEVGKAILNRLVLIPYKAEFKIDKSFENSMLEKKDEIFTFIMKYGNIIDNLDNVPEEMLILKKQYEDDNKVDYLQDFINDKIEFTDNHKILRDDFRLRYNGWCENHKYPVDKSTNTKFTRILKDKYKISNKESNGKSYYVNIKFKTENSEESD